MPSTKASAPANKYSRTVSCTASGCHPSLAPLRRGNSADRARGRIRRHGVLAKRLILMGPVLFLLACSAKADDIANVYFNGDYAFADNGYGIPPYQGTLNGATARFYCVDFHPRITTPTTRTTPPTMAAYHNSHRILIFVHIRDALMSQGTHMIATPNGGRAFCCDPTTLNSRRAGQQPPSALASSNNRHTPPPTWTGSRRPHLQFTVCVIMLDG